MPASSVTVTFDRALKEFIVLPSGRTDTGTVKAERYSNAINMTDILLAAFGEPVPVTEESSPDGAD